MLLRMRTARVELEHVCARAPLVFPEAGGCLTSPFPPRAIKKSVEAQASLLTPTEPASLR